MHAPKVTSPRRDLVGGLIVTALGAFQCGLSLERVVTGASHGNVFALLLGVALAASGVSQFRDGVHRALPDVPSAGTDAA